MSAAERVLNDAERREALRNGVDVRPGRLVPVEIVSRSAVAAAGVHVRCGTGTYEVHEADVEGLQRMVERDATKMTAAREHFEAERAAFEAAKGKGLPRPSLEASFTVISKRAIQPFDAVRVLSDEPAKKK